MNRFLERIGRLSHKQLALLAVELQSKCDELEQAQVEPIAVIGIGCRFPGEANDPEGFWRLLSEGRHGIREVPPDRWDIDAYYDPDPTARGKMSTRSGGFLKDVDLFDPQFFGISPREAEGMDPQQRLLLEVAWEALEHAGHSPDKLAGTRTGVFIGISANDYYQLHMKANHDEIDAYLASGSAHSIAVGRLSYVLGLRGPSMAIDTACSSSLVAVHLAVQSLRADECRLALAGGVNLILSPELSIGLSRAQMLSPEGLCKTFDAEADGYARGEGCGVVVLKRLSHAVADRDYILAVLLNTGVNQDGRSNGLTAPNGRAQEDLIGEVLARARINPREIGYVEAHGTGTSLGDPIEVQALNSVLGPSHTREDPLYVGSVKTNLGHLESAAGIAGLIKVVLALHHRQIPAHLNLKQLNPHIPWTEIPITVPTKPTDWPARDGVRMAAVSSFGFGGTNAHAIVGEAPAARSGSQAIDRPLHLFTLSAKSERALGELVQRFERHLTDKPVAIGDVCYTASAGRAHFSHRLAFTAESTEELRRALAAISSGQTPAGAIQGQVRSKRRPQVAFLFTGQGSQYVGMAKELYDSQPTFRRTIDHCNELLGAWLERPLLSVLYGSSDTPSVIDQTAYTQPALFAVEYALAELWRSWGIEPAFVMGHSIGEYVAACVAGIFNLEDGLKLVAERGRMMQLLPPNGAMAAVFAGEASVANAIRAWADRVSIAALNGPENTVISGETAALTAVLTELSARGIRSRRLNVSHAFHSPLMDPILDAFEGIASAVVFSAPKTGFLSNVTGRLATQSEVGNSSYWRAHLSQPVQFFASMAALREHQCDFFVEIGPTPTLLSMGQRCLPPNYGVWLPSLRRGQRDWRQMLDSLGRLYAGGVEVDWDGVHRDYSPSRIPLPTYPFERERYWIKSKTGPASLSPDPIARSGATEPTDIRRPVHRDGSALTSPDRVSELLFETTWVARPRCNGSPADRVPDTDRPLGSYDSLLCQPGTSQSVGSGTWVVFADEGGLGQGIVDLLRERGERCVTVRAGIGYQALADERFELNPAEAGDFARLFDEILRPDQPVFRGVIDLWAIDAHLTEGIDQHDLAETHHRVIGSALHIVQAVVARSQAPRLWLVTRGAQPTFGPHPDGDAAPIEPSQAAVWGLGRVIALEHPELRLVCIDLGHGIRAEAEEMQSLFLEICQPDRNEVEIALRGEARSVRRLTPMQRTDSTARSALSFRPDGTYLVTGAFGGLGLLIAPWMAERGARHLVLMSRHGPTPAAESILSRLDQLGVHVVVARSDVSVKEQLDNTIADIDRTGPPLRGIIHAAAVLDDGVVLNQTWERFAAVMAPKAEGTWRLHALTRHLALDFFLLFSSGASLVGSAGQGNYAAANAFLDAFAYYRRALGLPATVINWGPWSDVGVAARVSRDKQHWTDTIAPSEGLQTLEWLVLQNLENPSSAPCQVAVLPNNWARFRAQIPDERWPSLFAEIMPATGTANDSSIQREHSQSESEFLDQVAQIAPNKGRALLHARVREQAAMVLGLDPQRPIDPHKPLSDIGLDSLMAVELRNALGNLVRRVLPATLLFECPTISALVEYLAPLVMSVRDCEGTGAKPPQDASRDELDQLSEDELAHLLLEKLNQLGRTSG